MHISLETSVNRFNFMPITAVDVLQCSQRLGPAPQTPTALQWSPTPSMLNPPIRALYWTLQKSLRDHRYVVYWWGFDQSVCGKKCGSSFPNSSSLQDHAIPIWGSDNNSIRHSDHFLPSRHYDGYTTPSNSLESAQHIQRQPAIAIKVGYLKFLAN